jgi:hypothetical protein
MWNFSSFRLRAEPEICLARPEGFFGQRRLRDDDGRYFALGSNSKEGLELRSCSGTSGERLDRGGFVLMDIEHAVQFGGFQQIEDVDRGL